MLSSTLCRSITNRIIFARRPRTIFSNFFSFKFKRQPNVNFFISIGGQVDMSPMLSKMLQFSHSTRFVSHKWKIGSKRRKKLMHSLVDSTLNIGFNVSSNCYTVTKNKLGMITNKSLALKLGPKTKRENLLCIFHCDAWSHLDLE